MLKSKNTFDISRHLSGDGFLINIYLRDSKAHTIPYSSKNLFNTEDDAIYFVEDFLK